MVDPSTETENNFRKHEKKVYSEAELRYMIGSEIHKRTESKTVLWSKLGFALIPFIIAFFLWASSLHHRVVTLEQNQAVIVELRREIREINLRLHSIELILARRGLDE